MLIICDNSSIFHAGGSAWLLLMPRAFVNQLDAILAAISKRAPVATRSGVLSEREHTRLSLVPLFVGGVRWLMGRK